MPEVGIVMTLRDRVSNVMKSMINSGHSLSKEFEDLYERVVAAEDQQTALAKELAKTKTAITQQTDKVKASKKEWDALRKSDKATEESLAAKAAAFQQESEKLEELRNQLNEYTASSRDAREEVKELTAEFRDLRKASADAEESVSAGSSTLASGADSGILQKLSEAGLTKMLGDSASQLAGTLLESAAGQPLADAISSTLSGAATGFALGGLAGAGVGAIAGGISGVTQIYTAQDDAFQSYYQEAMQTVMDEQDEAITSGSSIAGSREQTHMAFAQRLGSDEAATEYLDQVKAMAANTNYSYDEITGYSKLLLNSYSADETFGVLQKLSDATAGLNLDTSDVSTLISGLSKMRTTGKATSEYLGYFSERGIDVYQALADATGADKSDIAGMVSKGDIGGAEAAEAILEYINTTFGGLSDKLASTYDGMVANLEDAEANLQAMAGEGYNEARKEGIAAQQNWLTDNTALEDAYKAIGAWEAELENSKEQFIRDAVDAMMDSEEYKQAEAAGDAAEMGKLIMQAKVQGMNEYNASDGAKLALEAELALAGAIRDDAATNQAYWDAGYRKSQEYSKGLAAGIAGNIDWGNVLSTAQDAWDAMGSYDATGSFGYGNAYGLNYVPYDGFPAVLHQGERVLTAGQARAQDAGAGTGQPFTIHIENATVREEADIDRIASAIVEKIEIARMAG